jgi:hypothetical protein
MIRDRGLLDGTQSYVFFLELITLSFNWPELKRFFHQMVCFGELMKLFCAE